jgi:hypothetical protein
MEQIFEEKGIFQSHKPLTTAWYQMEECSPILTSPMTEAEDAIKEHFKSGTFPRKATLCVAG